MATVVQVGTAYERERAGYTQHISYTDPVLFYRDGLVASGHSLLEARALAQTQTRRKTERYRHRNRPLVKTGG